MAGDRGGLLWLGTAGGGVNILDLESKGLQAYLQRIPGYTNRLNNNDVMGIYQDPGWRALDRHRQRWFEQIRHPSPAGILLPT